MASPGLTIGIPEQLDGFLAFQSMRLRTPLLAARLHRRRGSSTLHEALSQSPPRDASSGAAGNGAGQPIHARLQAAWNSLCSDQGPAQAATCIDMHDENHFTPLMLACTLPEAPARLACARFLLAKHASVAAQDGHGFTALHWAAVCADAALVRLLVGEGRAPVDAESDAGETPLHRAARVGRLHTCKALLALGADPLHRNHAMETPFDVAGSLDGAVSDKAASLVRAALVGKCPRLRCRLFTHTDCLLHSTREGHQEAPQRITAILKRVREAGDVAPALLDIVDSGFPRASVHQLTRAHSLQYVELVQSLSAAVANAVAPIPFTPVLQRTVGGASATETKAGLSDTSFSPGTFMAASRAAGAAIRAVDAVVTGECRHALCVVRPPGHHAGINGLLEGAACSASCGFCVFNTAAVAALHALDTQFAELPS
ncbi:hypothetical protein FNF27_06821 [Cafeteria roenbergensis]|uniref:histone deacetylase n=2 Tax=Cafeteria roenbergensis TaxID=33653 RepID=A0A5A8DWH6_CAFRO|nr:hypothetical protein FNF28_07784 [Cafeteria roenbergensis]KAA0146721.1 hypothetical protein FNF31_07724 [Cafeteria roenbergensis]KAA0149770.1 hypothetical protein FNF29_05780 [Cafeteria roenbergensis]KAA0169796.1 hypothetical protein FNF27_06821 [Cafeteria roenbergensis]|eukprot:KAA0149770.1 hypothetical protein FNF29_05780 [Cafeteria roenbergensis]